MGAGMSLAKRRLMLNEPHLVSAQSDGILTLDTDMRAPLKALRVGFEPVQEGEGDPSPENVRPITGWDRTTLFQKERGGVANQFRQLEYIETSGTEAFDTSVAPFEGFGFEVTFLAKSPVGASNYGCIFGGRVVSGTKDFQLTTYESNPVNRGTLRYGTSSPVIGAKITSGVKQKASLKNLIYTAPTGETTTVPAYTAFEGTKNLYLHALNQNGTVVQGGSGCRIYNVIIYNGSDVYREFLPCERVADGAIGYYEKVTGEFITALSGTPVAGPYVVSLLPISWQSSAGTVYGGYLELLRDGTVKLTATMVSVDMGTLAYTRITNAKVKGGGEFRANIEDRLPGTIYEKMLCSEYYITAIRGVSRLPAGSDMLIITSLLESDTNIYVLDSRYIDTTTFKSAVSGVQLVYTLATPVTYTLTPQEALRTLRGENNIWSDANGAISATYWTH